MILLDTCTLIWLVTDQARLSPVARELIAANSGALFVSALSGFEIAMQVARGRLRFGAAAEVWFERVLRLHGLRELPLDSRTAIIAVGLPAIHRDPVDRFLIAAARVHRLTLITPDETIKRYDDATVRW